ncbi:hypothetical protein AAIR98_001536 [Elusimicrobium simillimum]|uniref:DUF3788 domain-containing protein n=1 Tax=Elusimicrobium simillimum TaxID=3143438 RepID=UPI003C6F10D4
MKIKPPLHSEVEALTGKKLYPLWQSVTAFMEANYKLAPEWHTGGKAGVYELKFKSGGKTVCSLFAREKGIGFMVIYGAAERAKFEAASGFPPEVTAAYNAAKTYHDGKWIMFPLDAPAQVPVYQKLILIKKNPNKK